MSIKQAGEARARRAAGRVGLVVRKSRRQLSINNRGQYLLLDPNNNRVVAGEKFDLTPDQIIDYCARH